LGNTALMYSAKTGHNETVKALLDAGSNLNLKNNNEMTALMEAVVEGHIEIVKILQNAGAKE